jgi:hypothetical protein
MLSKARKTTAITNDKVIPTKRGSRSSETQKRMYSPVNGVVYNMLSKDPVALALKELRQKESVEETNMYTKEDTSLQMDYLEQYLRAINDESDQNYQPTRSRAA